MKSLFVFSLSLSWKLVVFRLGLVVLGSCFVRVSMDRWFVWCSNLIRCSVCVQFEINWQDRLCFV